jgi:anti-anti-sigma factor
VLTLICLNCGLTVTYQRSRGDYCPRCSRGGDKAVRLVTVSDKPSLVSRPRSDRLAITTRLDGDCQTLVLEGELDVASAPSFEETLEALCSEGAREVAIDLTGVDFIDSSGVNAILRGKTLCAERGRAFSLSPARAHVQRPFELTRLVGRLPFRKPGPLAGGDG